MKITYSNSYDRGEGYAADIQADAQNLTVTMYMLDSEEPPRANAVDGATVAPAWAGKRVAPTATISLALADIQALPSWQDRSVWTGCGWFLPDLMLPRAKHLMLWHNITAETYQSKIRASGHFMRFMRSSPLDLGAFLMFVPFKTSNFDECGLHILSRIAGLPHLYNGQPVEGVETDPVTAGQAIFPRLSISGLATVAPDATVALSVQLLDPAGLSLARDVDVYLDSTAGYLPKRRLRLIGGAGLAKLTALGLEVGDQIKLKAGFRFWTGDAEHTLGVA